jgi:archaetidylinositol phosphate synthase
VTIPAIAFVRTALNALDGMVATDTGVARSWGEVLNEFSDRLADVFLFAGLALSGLVSAPLAWVATIAVVLSEDIGVLSKAAGGARQYGGIMGKADRMVVMSLAALLAYITGANWPLIMMLAVVAIGCVATTIQRGRQTYESL